ncbi:MAG: NADH-quinone oxidoreductase subunit NuoE [Spirochaetia bacterium]|nr:NADH-quinone oxidoreductase subunit NuoE [Spirochaetia bacterium]
MTNRTNEKTKTMNFSFNESSMNEFRRWEKKFPEDPAGRRSLVIPALWISQWQHGYISRDVINYVAEITQTEPLHVWGVATFYTLFKKEKTGKFLLQFCTNITCSLMGGDQVFVNTCKKLGVKAGETTRDGMFTAVEVECLGACGESPTLQVNEKYYTHMTDDEVEKLVADLRKMA